MISNPDSRPTPKGAAIAERLRAHARLCEQVARDCWNEPTAADLKRIARDCHRAAARIAPACEPRPQVRH